MEYWENRNEKVQILQKIYNSGKETPSIIKEIVDIPEVQRLAGVDYNSGANLAGFGIFNYQYSILDHSIGVALILNNFITNNNQIISALLHDLDTPAFSKCIDLIDESNYNPKEIKLTVYDAIIGSDRLFDYFVKRDMSIEEMCDYTKYPLAHNVIPHISAHTLESFLHTMFMDNLCTEEEIKEIYDNLVVVPNEENMPEFCFLDEKIANKFSQLCIECGTKYRSYETKATIKFISDTIAAMVRREVITRKDLYTFSDRVIMEMGLSCSDKRISDRWRYLAELNKVYTKFNEVSDKHCSKVYLESKFVDPLIRLENGILVRARQLFDLYNKKVSTFLNSDTDLFFYVEYED